jgi:hypothetical protein
MAASRSRSRSAARIARGVGALFGLYLAAFSAWYWWEDPFLKRERTLIKLSVIKVTELPLDSSDFPQ